MVDVANYHTIKLCTNIHWMNISGLRIKRIAFKKWFTRLRKISSKTNSLDCISHAANLRHVECRTTEIYLQEMLVRIFFGAKFQVPSIRPLYVESRSRQNFTMNILWYNFYPTNYSAYAEYVCIMSLYACCWSKINVTISQFQLLIDVIKGKIKRSAQWSGWFWAESTYSKQEWIAVGLLCQCIRAFILRTE